MEGLVEKMNEKMKIVPIAKTINDKMLITQILLND